MRFLLLSLASLFLTATVAMGATFDVTWHATGKPGFVKIDGEGGKADCALDDRGLGSCELALDAFKTGIDLRDKHMKEKYLETAKWPKATLKVTKADAGAFAGDLTLKGVTKAVSGTYKLDGGAVVADFSIVLDDFKVGVPSYLGVTVAKDVAVHVSGKYK